MRRKSERNKTKGSPEKKAEKPTRKSTRRRGKRATSSSPDRDDSQDDTTSDASVSRESHKDSTCLHNMDLSTVNEEGDLVVLTNEIEEKDSSPETEDNGSVWKVARADESPGEIQKLKLCRQRNISETSDNSSSRKKSHKWQGSGEGIMEEIDSNDERLNSPRVEFSDKRPDDVSSFSQGQDSNQEVSDYKETLPESTSANLSDDKPNIDLQGDTNEAMCFNQSNDITAEPIGICADQISSEDVVIQAVSELHEIREDVQAVSELQQIREDVQAVSELQETREDVQAVLEFQEIREDVQAVSELQEVREEEQEIYNTDNQQQNILHGEFVSQNEQNPDLVDETNLNFGTVDSEQNNIFQPQEEQITPVEEQFSSENISEIREQISHEDNSNVPEQVFSTQVPFLEDPIVDKELQMQEKEEEIVPQETFVVQQETFVEQQETLDVPQETFDVPQETIDVSQETLVVQIEPVERIEGTPLRDQESPQRDKTVSKNDPIDSSSKKAKIQSDSNSIDEAQMKVRSSIRESSRNRRKNRTKYRESSYSDTPESEDDPSLERELKKHETPEEEEEEPLSGGKHFNRDRSRSKSLEPTDPSLLLNSEQSNNQNKEVKAKTEKSTSASPSNISEANTSSQKPAKINLKRTFGPRNSTDEVKNEEISSSVKVDIVQIVKTNHTNENTEQKRIPKKRRWGTTLSADSSIDFSVSTDSLKALVPGAKPLSITEVRLSKDLEEGEIRDKHITSDSNGEYKSREETSKSDGPKKGDTKADNHMVSASVLIPGSRRKISVVKDIPPSMLHNLPTIKTTNILLIKNLVRPFTLPQIKELLSRTGTIMENGFWMDRIKSKCFVEYSNEDQAFETRQALHGTSWPVSNPKRLQVEYASKEDLEAARNSSKDVSNSRKDDSHMHTDSWQHDWIREERNQGGVKVVVVREWDLGKEDGQHMIKDERDRRDMEKKKRHRSQTPTAEIHLPAPARKFKKKEDEPPPAKLLDDLFRKTKSTPCIYWLPLTNEQIVVKEEMRRQHMAEHARRLEEMRRAERNRDNRRRRSPRK